MKLEDGSAPINLYLATNEREQVNLEILCRASLAWCSIIREIGHHIDPLNDLEILIVESKEGSQHLKAFIRWLRRDQKELSDVEWVARGVFLFFLLLAAQEIYENGKKLLAETPEISSQLELTDPEASQFYEKMKKFLQGKNLDKQKKEFFQQLSADPAISGVAVDLGHGRQPHRLIVKEKFSSFLLDPLIQEEGSIRVRREFLPLTLISPVLTSKKRAWKFQYDGISTFSATMEDEKFLEALAEGKLDVKLRVGVKLNTELEIVEENTNGFWQIKKRIIKRVIYIQDGLVRLMI